MATQAEETRPTTGAVVPMTPQRENYAILKDKAKMFSLSPLIPDHLRAGGPDQAAANCLIALQMAEAMGEMPLVVMQNIHIVKGKAGFAAQYMIARANASGVFKGRIGWRVDRSDPKNLSVTAFAHLADTGEEVSFTVDMAMAQAEGWTSNSKYKTMPEVMLRYRSATFLVRFYAPDVMLGYQTSEEVEDVVLAARPETAPLTGQALLAQASDEEEDEAEEVETVDHAEGPADSQRGETHTETDAQRAACDRILARIGKAGTVIDLNLKPAEQADFDAMPEEMQGAIRAAQDERKLALGAGQ